MIDNGPACIGVDWANAARLAGRAPASGSEIAMLCLAVGPAGRALHESLGDRLSRLDRATITISLATLRSSPVDSPRSHPPDGWGDRTLMLLGSARQQAQRPGYLVAGATTHGWRAAPNQLALLYPGRLVGHIN